MLLEENYYLTESITHLEDLKVDEFIKRLENISKLIVSEKLDGANLWAGFDVNGKFYTSRAGKKKTAKPFYTIEDYPNISAYSGFKAAHLALEKVKDQLAKHIKPGQAFEIEILFGRQPNAVTYGVDGKSFIAFIRPVEGDGDTKPSEHDIDMLTKDLEGQDIQVWAEVLTSNDGEKLIAEKTQITWQVVKTHTLDAKELKTINFKKEIATFKRYLNSKNAGAKDLDMDLTNTEVLGISLTKVPVDKRPAMKELRTQVANHVLNKFKLPIKEKLLNDFVRKLKPKLQGTDLDNSEDTGVEGVVARDPDTGEMFKIVDKDVFTTINTFNWGARAAVDGIVRTDDPTAAPEMRGGAVGQSRIRIASLLGSRELAKASTAKRYLMQFKGKNEYDTAKKVADELHNLNFHSAKTKILAILSASLDEVGQMLRDFKKEVSNYQVNLKNGKQVSYSPEIKRRTLTSFAEVKQDLIKMVDDIKKAPNMTAILLVLYSRVFKSLFDEDLDEAVISISDGELLLEDRAPELWKLQKMDHDAICMAYQATLLGSLLLLRAQDRLIVRMLKDNQHAKMRKYSPTMSQLNFWGMVLFNPDVKEVKENLQPEVFRQLWKTGHRFMTQRIRNIHFKLSNQSGFIVDWSDQAENMRVVTLRLESRTENINIIRDGLVKWPDLSLGEQETVVTKTFYQLTQYVPTSPLISRVREFANKILLNANKNTNTNSGNLQMTDISKIKKLKEEGEGGGDGGVAVIPASDNNTEMNGSTGGFPLISSITNSNSIAGFSKRLFKNKVIVRRKPKKVADGKFERPTEVKGDK